MHGKVVAGLLGATAMTAGLLIWLVDDHYHNQKPAEGAVEKDGRAPSQTTQFNAYSSTSGARIAALERRLRSLEQREQETGRPAEAQDDVRGESKHQRTEAPAQRVSRIDRAFSNESFDQNWSTRVENEIVAVLDSEESSGSERKDLQCRTTFCRLRVIHSSEDARDAFEKVAGRVHMGAVGIPTDEDGQLGTTIYYIRKEYDSPSHPARQIF